MTCVGVAVFHYRCPDCCISPDLAVPGPAAVELEDKGCGFVTACLPGAYPTGWELPVQLPTAGATAKQPCPPVGSGQHAEVPAASSGGVLVCTALSMHMPYPKPLFCDVAVLTQRMLPLT